MDDSIAFGAEVGEVKDAHDGVAHERDEDEGLHPGKALEYVERIHGDDEELAALFPRQRFQALDGLAFVVEPEIDGHAGGKDRTEGEGHEVYLRLVGKDLEVRSEEPAEQ